MVAFTDQGLFRSEMRANRIVFSLCLFGRRQEKTRLPGHLPADLLGQVYRTSSARAHSGSPRRPPTSGTSGCAQPIPPGAHVPGHVPRPLRSPMHGRLLFPRDSQPHPSAHAPTHPTPTRLRVRLGLRVWGRRAWGARPLSTRRGRGPTTLPTRNGSTAAVPHGGRGCTLSPDGGIAVFSVVRADVSAVLLY